MVSLARAWAKTCDAKGLSRSEAKDAAEAFIGLASFVVPKGLGLISLSKVPVDTGTFDKAPIA
jgi:hypothetical protein